MDLLNLENPLYTQQIKPRGYNCPVNLFGLDVKAAAQRIAKELPTLAPADADLLHTLHDIEARNLAARWGMLANKAAFDVWGREYRFTDYKISGIASDEFPTLHKNLLRAAAHAQGKHVRLAAVFFELARILRRKK